VYDRDDHAPFLDDFDDSLTYTGFPFAGMLLTVADVFVPSSALKMSEPPGVLPTANV